jgi:hypothetical protein
MLAYFNRVRQATATTGTGALTLGAAVAGFRTLQAAGAAANTVLRYWIEDGSDWEYGRGVFNGTTGLTRTLRGSSTGALLNLSGNATVFCDVAAEDLVSAVSDPFRNLIINGNFAINQRQYASGAALSAGAYAHDRWRCGATGAAYSYSTAANGDTTVTITSTLMQVIEGAFVVRTGYVLSWTGTAQARYATGGSNPAGAYAASPLLITAGVGANINIEFNAGTLGLVQCEPCQHRGRRDAV